MGATEEDNEASQSIASPSRHVVRTYSHPASGQHDDQQQSQGGKSKSQIIFDLIENQQWEAVVQYLERNPQAAKCRHHVPNAIQYNLPLHEACRRQPPFHVINLLLNLYEDAVHTAGQYGFLPLHIACGSGSCHEVIMKLLEVFPAATRCRDDVNESLPLHLAAQWGASEEVLMEVLSTYPEGSLIRDASGKTPLDYAKALSDDATKDFVLATLKLAPVLIATAKSATRRIEHELESRVRSAQESHRDFIQKLEQQHEDEKTDFLAMEVQFHIELATEKERNCELAERIIQLQNEREVMIRQQETMQQRLEEQQKALDAQRAKHQEDLQALEKAMNDNSSKYHQEREMMIRQHEDTMQQCLEEQQRIFDAKWAKHQEDLQALEKSIDDDDSSDIVDSSQPVNEPDTMKDKVDARAVVTIADTQASSTPCSAPIQVSLKTIARLIADYKKIKAQLDETTSELGKSQMTIKELEDSVHEKERQIMHLSLSLELEQDQRQEAVTHLRQLEVSHKEVLQELSSVKNEMNRLRSKSDTQQQQLRESARFIRQQDRSMKDVKNLVMSLCQNINEWPEHEDAPWMTESHRQEEGPFTPRRKNGIHHVDRDVLAQIQSTRTSPIKQAHLPDDDCDEINSCGEKPTSETAMGTDKVQNVSATFSKKSLKIDQNQKDASSTIMNDHMLSMAWNELDTTSSDPEKDAAFSPKNSAHTKDDKTDESIASTDCDINVDLEEETEPIERGSDPADESPQWWEQALRDNMNDKNADEFRSIALGPDEMDNIQNLSAILPEESCCHHSEDGEVHDLVHQVQVSQSVDDEGNNDESMGMEVTVVKTKTDLDGSFEKSENTAMITEISNTEADDHEENMSMISLVREFVSIRPIE